MLFFLEGPKEKISERGTEAEIVALIFSLLAAPSTSTMPKN